MGRFGSTLISLIMLFVVSMYSPCANASDPIKIYLVGGPELKAADVIAGKYQAQETQSTFQLFQRKPYNAGWWRVEIDADVSVIERPMLYISSISLTESEVWLPGSTAAFRFSQLNRTKNYGFSPRNLVVALPKDTRVGDSIYWRINSGEISPIKVGLASEQQLRLIDSEQARWHSVVEGALLALVLAGLVLSLMLRESSFLILAAGTFASLLFVLANNGDIFYFPVIASLDAEFPLQRLFGLAASMAMNYFVYIFLEMRVNTPRLAVFQRWIIAAFCLLFVASLFPFFKENPLGAILGNILLLLGTINGISAGVLLMRKGNRLGQLYLLSWLPLMFLGGWRIAEIMLGLPFNATVSLLFPASYVLAGILLYLGLGERILMYKHQRDANEQLARIDSLTDVYNRRALDERLRISAAQAEKSGRSMAVLFADIDHFKVINDTHGHAVGDVVLREVTSRIRGTLRFGDVLGRYGGEEFVIALPDCAEEEALQLAERIRHSIAESPISTPDAMVTATVSIGVSVLSDGLSGVDNAIKRADKALYHCKQTGRNRVAAQPT